MIEALWTNLRAALIGAEGDYDALLDFLHREIACALRERAERDRCVRGDLLYNGSNARELQKMLAEKIA